MMRLEIHGGSPYFSGHFPGHPILPAIAHLFLIGSQRGDPPLARVRHLRLRRPVGPGDVLELSTREQGETVRFEWRRGAETVSNGEIVLGGLGQDRVETPDESPPTGRYPPPGELVPHAPPALLVQSIVDVREQCATTLAVVPPDNPFVRDGRGSAVLALEAAAQTAAVMEALGRSGVHAGPRVGYIVAVRNVFFRAPWLPIGRPLAVTVRPVGQAPPLTLYEFSVGGGSRLAEGSISTFIAPTPS